jgi:nucleoid DNA-binding protein
MNRNELIRQVQEATIDILTQRTVGNIVNAVFLALTSEDRYTDPLIIRGVGTFGVKMVPSRTCRNPQTRVAVLVPAKMRPYWRPTARLVRIVGGKGNKKK